MAAFYRKYRSINYPFAVGNQQPNLSKLRTWFHAVLGAELVAGVSVFLPTPPSLTSPAYPYRTRQIFGAGMTSRGVAVCACSKHICVPLAFRVRTVTYIGRWLKIARPRTNNRTGDAVGAAHGGGRGIYRRGKQRRQGNTLVQGALPPCCDHDGNY